MSLTIDWKSIILHSDWLARLDAIALRRFSAGGLAEEATTYVLEQLAANDWACCKNFAGHARPETYLNTLATNLLEEFSRKRFGRPRPPTWLQNQGDLWVQIWRLVCLERHMPEWVVSILASRGTREADEIRAIIKTIKGRLPHCGESPREISTQSLAKNQDEEPDAGFEPVDTLAPEQYLDRTIKEELHSLMDFMLRETSATRIQQQTTQETVQSIWPLWRNKLEKFRQNLVLSDEEVIVLRMFYIDELKYSVIAQSLGMQAHLPGRIVKRCLQKINQQLQEADIDLGTLRELIVGEV